MESDTQVHELDLYDFIQSKDQMSLSERTASFRNFISVLQEKTMHTYYQTVRSATGRHVEVVDPATGRLIKALMFASNNYLGLANHPYVKEQVTRAIKKYGVGIGGPPLLNGYSFLMQEVEERLADLKGHEEAMIFPAGFLANLGMVTGLSGSSDTIIYDEYSHASLHDALRMTHASSHRFKHNDVSDLEMTLAENASSRGETFVAVEGVYSMDGNLGRLNEICALCTKYNALLLLDDAHGTGVLGDRGSGTAEHLNVERHIDVSMGTFSKTFAVTGGFLCGSHELINYLRYFVRSYMFSAALPPVTLAAVNAGLDIIRDEPERRRKLLDIANYTKEVLCPFGFYAQPEAAIIALKVPVDVDIRRANALLREMGFFVSAIEYPAVKLDGSRFRISLMAEHTKEDIDNLAEAFHTVFNDDQCKSVL